ncbi:MAG: DEAD/DEAH box helicase family protein [Anaerolineae bacterium]|nr:DEAD/DEAH box helicase family protein [Anaerolineae bacterium]
MNKKLMTEQEIRSAFIRPAIVAAGWQGLDVQIREEFFLDAGRMNIQGKTAVRGSRNFMDYLLVYKNVPLAVVEAKDNRHSIGSGMQQALRYAQAYDVPFAYSSNGDGFLEHNRLAQAGNIERELALDAFPQPELLWQQYVVAKNITPEQEAIVTERYYTGRDVHNPRYFQEVAIKRAVTAVAQGQNRVLLVMATGTGKTYTAFQIIWRLWQARKAKRVLFLADRNILVSQAKTGDFKHFGDKMTWVQKREVNKSYEIYLALYQAVSGTEEDQNIYKQFSRDFFDLVVIDECHRGSAAADSAWREILAYYDTAVHIGLTATPKETDTVSNIDYFGEPIYTYSLKQGIEDGFLAPYKVIRINVDKDIDGWIPAPGDVDKYGHIIEQREYTVRDWDKTIVIEQRNELVAQRIAEYLRQTDPFAKTIVFCVDIDHAERMRQALVNAIGGEALENRKYVMRITGDNDEGKLELDNFITPESKYPVVVTTSKLMTTGVDAQTCKLIVLDTVINSMTEFKQIIGRGTRLRPDFGKTHFTIMDFRNATRLFADPEFDGEPVQSTDYDGSGPIDFPDTGQDDEPDDGEEKEKRIKFVVDNVAVHIVAERVQYLDQYGKLVTKSFSEFSGDNVRKVFRSLDDFLQKWGNTVHKQAILVELINHGVLLDDLQDKMGEGYDPFDLICHVAYDLPLQTRKERASRARQALVAAYSDIAQEVLAGLLEKYADEGIGILEEAAEPKKMAKMLRVRPFTHYGSPKQIVDAFGGRDAYLTAVRQLSQQIYTVS